MPVMDLGPYVQPQADRAPRKARESLEVIEEIERETPNTQDPPPQLFADLHVPRRYDGGGGG